VTIRGDYLVARSHRTLGRLLGTRGTEKEMGVVNKRGIHSKRRNKRRQSKTDSVQGRCEVLGVGEATAHAGQRVRG